MKIRIKYLKAAICSRCLLETVTHQTLSTSNDTLYFIALKVRNRLHNSPIFLPTLTHMKSNPQPPH